MSKWEQIYLNECVELNMGQSPASSTYNTLGNGLPFFQGNADFGETTPNVKYFCSEPIKIANKGDLLISVRAPIGALNFASEKCCIGRGLCSLSAKSCCNIKYLFYILQYKKSELNAKGTGSTFKAINKQSLSETKIPLPLLEEQHKIASILDTVSEALKLRKQQLNELDLLVKSKFVEMFGDPVMNSKKLPTTELINVIKLQRGYDLPTQNRSSSGNIPVYGSNGILDYHNEAKTINGIITGRSGTIGKVYYCFDKYWPLNTTLFSIDTHGNNILYLSLLLQYFKLERFYSGTGVPTLNRNIIHKEQIIVVSIKEQNKFASFVQHVDELKSEVQKSIDQLQALFDSLMQQYFE